MARVYGNIPTRNYFDNDYPIFRPGKNDKFEKITPTNGFDENDSDNAMQNNYAWSMTEMGNYLYVGTGRNVLITMLNAMSQTYGIDIDIPADLQPENTDMRAEIWRYKKDGSKKWEKVFKAPEGVFGFRFMIPYTTPSGETAIYASSYQALGASADLKIFKSTDGKVWKEITNNIPGNSSRAMVIHNGKIYMSVVDESGKDRTLKIYVSTDPEKNGWELVTPPGGDPAKNPGGQATVMVSFNGHLYVGIGAKDGFELWRTLGNEPKKDMWKLIIDKGAGDASNRAPLTLATFKDKLYVATIALTLSTSASASKIGLFSLFKPVDLIRIDRYDRWELVMGSPPVDPTNPTTGKRGKPISGLSSGAGNIANLYAWQLKEYAGYFYLGSFDWLVVLLSFINDNISPTSTNFDFAELSSIKNLSPTLINLIIQILRSNFDFSKLSSGFDFYRSRDGVHWETLSLNGLGNGHNYGIRNLFVSKNGHLYIGTANPYDGCEVWVNRHPQIWKSIYD